MTSNAGCNFRSLFASQVRLAEGKIDLQLAALYLAGEEYPELDADSYIRRMDDMAAEIESLANGHAAPDVLARALHSYLFDVKGFSGNAGDYYDPANSFLNRVMDTGIGIPITLSVLYMGLAARLGMNCHGVGMPAHFLVKNEELDLYVDPFNGGQLLSAGDCRRLAEQLFGANLAWNEHFLSPTPDISVLFRMLNNLRMIYSQRRDLYRLAGALERMLLIDPTNGAISRNLAHCYIEQGDNTSAVKALEEFIKNSTSEEDSAVARKFIESILRDG